METVERTGKEQGKEFPGNFHGYFVVLDRKPTCYMYTSLLLKAFEKAESILQSRKSTHLAQHLSDYIQEQSGEPYGEKSLRNHYKAAKNGNPIDLKKFVANALGSYLGYANFEEYVMANPVEPQKKKGLWTQYKVPIIGLLIVLISAFVYHTLTKERWMVWQEDQYMEVSFDENLLQQGLLKVYKEERITDFKKIKVDCNTAYKTPDGSALVWYGKNPAGKLEYFTSPGLHPETSKTLKELSKYMFDKHICPK